MAIVWMIAGGAVVYIIFALKKYQDANAVGLRSMSEWLGVLEHSNAKQRKKMSHSLILFTGKNLERQGILPKNGLRNAIILNREVSKTNFIILVGEEAANLDSFDIAHRDNALDITIARDYFSYCLTLILAKRGAEAIAMLAFKSRYPL